MIFITSKVLNLVRSARNRLRPVWITFGIVLSVFSKHIKVPYKFFDIVQFSRSCAPQPCGWRPVYCTTEVVFCQALFFRSFWAFWTWTSKKFLRTNWNFSASIGSFQGLLAEALEVILLPQRLALTYSTTFKRLWQVFFTSFFVFLVICIQRTVFLPVISSFLTGIFLIINIGLQARFCSAPEPLFRP